MPIDHKKINKILILRYRSIGDIILSFPTLEALRLSYPNARIDMVIDDKYADICYEHPYIDYLIFNRRKRGDLGKLRFFRQEIKFIWKIYKQKYDLVVDLHAGPRSALLTFLSGATYRVGCILRLRNKLFYNINPPPSKYPHTVETMLSVIGPLKPKLPERKSLFLKYREEDKQYIENFLSRFDITDKDKIVLVHPGARVDFKKLPAEKMGKIVSWMTAEFGVKVILAGADSDLAAISGIAATSGQTCLMATNLTLGQLAALIDSSSLFIGNDSGPMHMAAALGVPIVAFFGPSDPKIWSPWRGRGRIVRSPKMDCMPCDQKRCRHVPNHCMARIRVGDAKLAIWSVLYRRAIAVGAR